MWDVQSISGSGYYSITTRKTLQPLAGLHGYSSGEPKSKPVGKPKPLNRSSKTCPGRERSVLFGNTVKALRWRISFRYCLTDEIPTNRLRLLSGFALPAVALRRPGQHSPPIHFLQSLDFVSILFPIVPRSTQ